MSRRNAWNLFVVAAVIGLVATTAWIKAERGSASASARPLPRLVELGAGKCEDCKKMAPIIAALKSEYRGRVIVDSIDVLEQSEVARAYGWRLIPTQVFIDADGNEVWRHEGFLPRNDILARLAEMGVD